MDRRFGQPLFDPQPQGQPNHPPKPLGKPRLVATLTPATITGTIDIAVLVHEGSTLLVLANALRLLACCEPKTI